MDCQRDRLSLKQNTKDVENLRQIVFFLHPPRGPGDPLRLASSNSSCTAEAGASGDHKLGRPSWPSKSSWGSCNVALPLWKGLGCWDWDSLKNPRWCNWKISKKRERGTSVSEVGCCFRWRWMIWELWVCYKFEEVWSGVYPGIAPGRSMSDLKYFNRPVYHGIEGNL